MKSQIDLIFNRLKSGRSITAIEALNKYGCFRLAARINELSDLGHNIKSEYVTRKDKTYKKYFI